MYKKKHIVVDTEWHDKPFCKLNKYSLREKNTIYVKSIKKDECLYLYVRKDNIAAYIIICIIQ